MVLHNLKDRSLKGLIRHATVFHARFKFSQGLFILYVGQFSDDNSLYSIIIFLYNFPVYIHVLLAIVAYQYIFFMWVKPK